MMRSFGKISRFIISFAAGVVLLGFSATEPASAINLKALRSLKVKELPRRHFDALAAATFKVPVQVTDLPQVLWGSDLVVECLAVYGVEGQGFAGMLKGRTTLQGALGGASYQQQVSVPASDLTGGMSDQAFGMCVAMAGKGGQCMALGTGCAGGGTCDNIVGFTMNCSESFFEKIMEGQTVQLAE